jgi:hypothetical protein
MNDRAPHVYDKAKYHVESVSDGGLPESHASNHIVPMLRWLIEHNLMSEFFLTEGADELARYRAGEIAIHELFESWDTCLVDDMLSDEGNAFAMAYFDYEKGQYIHDYVAELKDALPTEFHIPYSEANYARIASVIDARHSVWLQKRSKPWWQFWR